MTSHLLLLAYVTHGLITPAATSLRPLLLALDPVDTDF